MLGVGGEGIDGAGVGRDYRHCSNNNSVKRHQFWCLLLRHRGESYSNEFKTTETDTVGRTARNTEEGEERRGKTRGEVEKTDNNNKYVDGRGRETDRRSERERERRTRIKNSIWGRTRTRCAK